MLKQQILSDLITLAKTGQMTSRHAAAIMYKRQTLCTAINHALPCGEVVDAACDTVKKIRGGFRNPPPCVQCCWAPCQIPTTRYNRLYQRSSKRMREQRDRHQTYKQPEVPITQDGIGPCAAC